ncbi:hypothetical protein, partial [Nocardioides sp.]|uniref:hypothetical protein n=1 Tax=Nocardioides sp. TaxID=35761 RepID=UPI0027328D35
MRFSGWAAVAVLMTGSLAGCTFGDKPEAEPVPVEALEPPENLCDLVPGSTVDRWGLEADSNRRDARAQHTKWAQCQMTGLDGNGEPVLLSARITTYGDLGDPGPARMSEAVRDRCDVLRGPGDGDVTSEDAGCAVVMPAGPATRMTSATIMRRAEGSVGVVQVQVSQRDQLEQDLESDAESVVD